MVGESGKNHVKSSFLMLVFIAGLIVGSVAIYYIVSIQINGLKNDISNLQNQVSRILGNQTVIYEYINITQNGVDLSELYQKVKNSVVLIRGT